MIYRYTLITDDPWPITLTSRTRLEVFDYDIRAINRTGIVFEMNLYGIRFALFDVTKEGVAKRVGGNCDLSPPGYKPLDELI